VTCHIQCSAKCDRRMVDVRLDTLAQNLVDDWTPSRLQGMRNRRICEHRGELA
jgi:hypothetical protein